MHLERFKNQKNSCLGPQGEPALRAGGEVLADSFQNLADNFEDNLSRLPRDFGFFPSLMNSL